MMPRVACLRSAVNDVRPPSEVVSVNGGALSPVVKLWAWPSFGLMVGPLGCGGLAGRGAATLGEWVALALARTAGLPERALAAADLGADLELLRFVLAIAIDLPGE